MFKHLGQIFEEAQTSRLNQLSANGLRRPAGREIKKIRFSDHVIFRCIGILYSYVQEHISIFQE